MPKLYGKDERPHHPFTDDYARTVDYDPHFTSPADVKRAIAGYSGLVSSMDENVGDVLQRLRAAGLEDKTRVLYTSDHGDNAGARGLWGKSTFYEESAGVPLIVAGPGVHGGRVVATPVSHIDCAPTILEAVGAAGSVGGKPLPGASLFAVAEGATPARPVISEYHAISAVAGAFMLRFGKWKYCHYVAYPPAALRPRGRSRGTRRPCGRRALRRCRRRRRAATARHARSGRSRRPREASASSELLASFGGREAALARGDLGFTPAPGTAPEMN